MHERLVEIQLEIVEFDFYAFIFSFRRITWIERYNTKLTINLPNYSTIVTIMDAVN